MSDSFSDSSDLETEGDEQEEAADQYPPWLQGPFRRGPVKVVRVLKKFDADDHSREGFVRCKAIEVPDAVDDVDVASGNKKQADIRLYTLQRYTTVLVMAGADEPPYIGLVDKIWRKADAQQLGVNTYHAADFWLECYWFYRRNELPDSVWGTMRGPSLPTIKGARFRFAARGKPRVEGASERQLLFSSHHTYHDNEDGLVRVDAVLQTCKMHWVGSNKPPERYSIHSGRLVCVREPGFLVQGFLWCGRKGSPQLLPHEKSSHRLTADWKDEETMNIVEVMCKRYDKKAAEAQRRNQHIIDKYKQQQGQEGATSDDGEEYDQQQRQRQRQQEQQARQQTAVAATADQQEQQPARKQQRRQQQLEPAMQHQQQLPPPPPPPPLLPAVYQQQYQQQQLPPPPPPYQQQQELPAEAGAGYGLQPLQPWLGARSWSHLDAG